MYRDVAVAEVVAVPLVVFVALVVLTVCTAAAAAGNRRVEEGGEHAARGEVTYDGRALIVNGTRRMLFSGEIHYTRSTPEMWPKLVAEARKGGLDVIQTYVFWNVHEPVQDSITLREDTIL